MISTVLRVYRELLYEKHIKIEENREAFVWRREKKDKNPHGQEKNGQIAKIHCSKSPSLSSIQDDKTLILL